MQAAMDVAERCKQIGINALHVKLRATGGNRTRTPGPGGQSALRALARSGMRIGRIGKGLTALHPMQTFVLWVLSFEYLQPTSKVFDRPLSLFTTNCFCMALIVLVWLSTHICPSLHRGRDTCPYRLHPPKERSPWSSSVKASIVSYTDKRND